MKAKVIDFLEIIGINFHYTWLVIALFLCYVSFFDIKILNYIVLMYFKKLAISL